MTDEVKPRRGRPKLTDEERARRKAERKARGEAGGINIDEIAKVKDILDKMANAQSQAAQNVIPAVKDDSSWVGEGDPGYEARKIAEIEAAMDKAHRAQAAQQTPPTMKVTPRGGGDIVETIHNQEIVIEDEPRSAKPDFVQKDDAGWEEIP